MYPLTHQNVRLIHSRHLPSSYPAQVVVGYHSEKCSINDQLIKNSAYISRILNLISKVTIARKQMQYLT